VCSPDFISVIRAIRGCLRKLWCGDMSPLLKARTCPRTPNSIRLTRGCAVESAVPSGESECAEDSARYNIRVHSWLDNLLREVFAFVSCSHGAARRLFVTAHRRVATRTFGLGSATVSGAGRRVLRRRTFVYSEVRDSRKLSESPTPETGAFPSRTSVSSAASVVS
jgi:hypothetical protein